MILNKFRISDYKIQLSFLYYQGRLLMKKMKLNFNQNLFKKHNISGPRYTSYPTAPNFHDDISDKDRSLALTRSNHSGNNLSLYFHIPFCHSLCYFCGCTMKVTRNQELVQKYLSSLYKEISLTSESIDPTRNVTQIHFGGGTPNFLTPEQILDIGAFIRSKFTLSDSAEISCEIDPRTFSKEHAESLVTIGVNRVSIGVQDFNSEVQEKINRINPFSMVNEVVSQLKSMGIKEINFDLIYGLPGQTVNSFDATLDKMISLHPSRLAIYNFAYVPWLKPHQKLIREEELPSPETKLSLLQLMIEKLTNAGYEYIGMDHFAKMDDSLTIAQKNGTLYRNFQGYSTQKDTDLFGFGLTSISQFGHAYFQNNKEFKEYYQALDNNELPLSKGLIMTDSDRQIYSIIMGLMCNLELNYNTVSTQIGVDFEKTFAKELTEIHEEFAYDGLVNFTEKGIEITNTGRLYIRNIAMKFDKYLQTDKSLYSKTV